MGIMVGDDSDTDPNQIGVVPRATLIAGVLSGDTVHGVDELQWMLNQLCAAGRKLSRIVRCSTDVLARRIV